MQQDFRHDVGILSPTHAAEWLDIGLSTLYKLMHRGEIPYLRIGRNRRIRVADLEAYVEQQLKATSP